MSGHVNVTTYVTVATLNYEPGQILLESLKPVPAPKKTYIIREIAIYKIEAESPQQALNRYIEDANRDKLFDHVEDRDVMDESGHVLDVEEPE